MDKTYKEQQQTEQTIVKQFEEQAVKHSEKIAVKSCSKELTYKELNNTANKFARLIAMKQKPQSTVALLYEHEADMIIGILSALKTGSIYVPLDPTYPENRLQYMLQDSAAAIIVTNNKNINLAQKLAEKSETNISIINTDFIDNGSEDENLNINIRPDQTAYIIYTSGSTGNPKGVMQSHKNVVFHVNAFIKGLHMTHSDKLALFTSYSHTVGILDILGMLFCGGTVYPYDIKKDDSLKNMSNWLKTEEITIFHSVPTLFRHFTKMLGKQDTFEKMRIIMLGGEAVYNRDFELYKAYFSDNCKFVNILGSTEVMVTTFDISDKQAQLSSTAVPAGYPIQGVDILLLDDNDKQVSEQEIGELVYKSQYLAQGYNNLTEKTNEVFTPDPITGEGRVYRSGDIGRILADGRLEYLGRKDSQIKIRGYRIEPGEIENKILKHQKVKEAVVVAKEDANGDKYLCSYIVTEDDLDIQELADSLGVELPSYMLPAYFVELEEMPLTANGKIDIKALPEVEEHSATAEYEAPRNYIEEKLAEIWSSVLSVEKVGIHDDFFALGGSSINSLRIVSKAAEYNIKITVGDILNNKTIANIVKMLNLGKAQDNNQDEETILF